jgi:hypothetical protein
MLFFNYIYYRCIKTYEIQFSAGASGKFHRINPQDTIFLSFQYSLPSGMYYHYHCHNVHFLSQYGNTLCYKQWVNISAFFLGRCRGPRTPKHFVNLTGESKTFKMLEFPLNQLQTYYGYLCDLFPLTAFIFFWFELQNGDFLESNWEYPQTLFLEKKHWLILNRVSHNIGIEHINSIIFTKCNWRSIFTFWGAIPLFQFMTFYCQLYSYMILKWKRWHEQYSSRSYSHMLFRKASVKDTVAKCLLRQWHIFVCVC